MAGAASEHQVDLDNPADARAITLSFVFPCLNEAGSLESCIEAVRASLSSLEAPWEVIVADNGSTDGSREIAARLGVRMVEVATRGYGAALRAGIEAARGEYVVFADADGTYLYEDASALYLEAVAHGADMVVASRLTDRLESGANPALHRHLGTPVLTGLINILYGGKLSDCNSGFRCVRKSAYASWGIGSTGMEFASELLIKALKAGAQVVEVPSGLKRAAPDRMPHLRTWRDGMRHLLFILSQRPQLFEWSGLLLTGLTSVLQIAAEAAGPRRFGIFNIFDTHSVALLMMGGFVGIQLYLLACSMYLNTSDKPLAPTRFLIHLDEGVLFFLLLGLFATDAGVAVFLVAKWAAVGFAGLSLVANLLFALHFLGIAGFLMIGLLGVHMSKRGRAQPLL